MKLPLVSALVLTLAASAASAEEDGPIDDVGREHRASTGAGLTIGAGASAAARSMTFAGARESIDHTPGPFLGGALELALNLHYFEEAEAGLRLEGRGSYLTGTDSEPDPELGRPLVVESSEIGIAAIVTRSVHEAWDLRLGAGFELVDHSVETNSIYEGHTYLSLRFEVGVDWWNDDDSLRATIATHILPALSVSQSEGQYGESSGFGARLELGGGWIFLRPNVGDMAGAAELVVQGRATRYRAQFPSGGVVGARASSDDDVFDITLGLRYHL